MRPMVRVSFARIVSVLCGQFNRACGHTNTIHSFEAGSNGFKSTLRYVS